MDHRLVVALCLAILGLVPAAASADPRSELRQQIVEAGLVPWNGGKISLDETLRGPRREEVSLRRLVGKPIVAYNYAEW